MTAIEDPADVTSGAGTVGSPTADRTTMPRPAPKRGRHRVDWQAVRAVLDRDLGAVRQSKATLLPMLALPLFMLVLLPASVGFYAKSQGLDANKFLELLPISLADQVRAYPPQQQVVVLVLGYLVAPLFLIVPLMVSAVLASDTFAGEKERKTLETILHLPVDDRDLYLAKLLGGYLPAVAITWAGFVLFTIVANAACWPVMHRIFLPTWTFAVVIFWMAPAVAAIGLGIMVRVSIRVANTQEAQQLGGAVVLPLVVLAVGQTSSLLLRGTFTALVVGAVAWAIALWLNIRGAASFTREKMASRL